MIDYASELNESQLEAVEIEGGSALVIAGAGSGKTRVLVFRVARLVEKGVDPESILLLTFTRKAAREMMDRAADILDARCSRIDGGTFHSFANRMLRKYAKYVGLHNNFTIMDTDDSQSAINQVRAKLGFDKSRERFPKKGTIHKVISKSINTGDSVSKILYRDFTQFSMYAEEIAEIAAEYAVFKKERDLVDYDDLLVFFRNLLRDNEQVRKAVSGRYQYIMVDEFQDTNRLQGHIASLLASETGNIMVVGDDAQSIYSFRGANFRNIMDFPQIFENTKVITLEQNYRSVQPILNLTNRVIGNAREKFSKELYTEKAGDQLPVFVNIDDEEGQAEFVCEKILELREEGVSLDDMAVLFRNSFHSNELEVELAHRNIPYVKYGGIKFLEAAHVKDAVSFLRTVYNGADVISWRRILLLLPGIGDKTASRIITAVTEDEQGYRHLADPEFAKKKYGRDLARLRHLYKEIGTESPSVGEMIQMFMSAFDPMLKEKYDDYHTREEDLKSLIAVSDSFSSLEHFLTQLSLEPPERSLMEQADTEDEVLTLSTVHSAKGLEWHTVFILSLLEGFLPDKRCLDREEDIEEERRLFYVAATRAEENLFLCKPSTITKAFTFYADPGFTSMMKTTRFLTEIDDVDEFMDYTHYVKSYEKDEDYSIDYNSPRTPVSRDALDRIRRYYD